MWTAKILSIYEGKLQFTDVSILDADSVHLLSSFCKKLEKQNLKFNFAIEDLTIKSKEESDNFIRFIQRIPYNNSFSNLTIAPKLNLEETETETETEVETKTEDELESDIEPEIEIKPKSEIKASGEILIMENKNPFEDIPNLLKENPFKD